MDLHVLVVSGTNPVGQRDKGKKERGPPTCIHCTLLHMLESIGCLTCFLAYLQTFNGPVPPGVNPNVSTAASQVQLCAQKMQQYLPQIQKLQTMLNQGKICC